MRCLVTGATGFVGGGVLRGLAAAGHEVVAFVREGADSRELASFERVVGDIGDPNRLATAAADCDAVIHAAGIADARAHADTLGWTHVAGTENVINAARKAGCRRLVHISCADVTMYDGPRSFWNESDAPQRPFGDLAQTKLQAEELVRVSGKRGFWTVALRPSLVWGPGDLMHIREWKSEAESGGVRIVGGGKTLMATTYIGNLAHAVVRSLETGVTTGNVYYVVDEELSVSREFFQEVSERLDWPPLKFTGPYSWAWLSCRAGLSRLHPTEVIRRGRTNAFDMTRAKEDLGYAPVYTREQGLAELAEWMREHKSAA